MSNSLGGRIRDARKKAGLTQKQLAEKIGVDCTTLNRYEKEHRRPDSRLLCQLVSVLNCDAGWLLTGEEPLRGSLGPDIVTEKILQLLDGMEEDKRRDVLKYIEEKKLLEVLLEERRRKEAA